MSLIYIPQRPNPWEQMLPSFLSNLTYQSMARRFQESQAELRRKQDEQKELRTYQAAGYRESEADRPDVEVAGKGLMAPKTTIQYRDMGNGTILPVIMQQKYGESTAEPLKLGSAIKADMPYKIGETKDFKSGDKIITGVYTGDKNDSLEGLIGWRETPLGGPRYKPTTNVNINNKIMPASEVGKIGEFKAYEDTIAQIQSMADSKKIDTGPFEFLKKKSDDWGILPNEERIQLRTLVARLPGLMYAMRGKQLSDKELEVALEMMPKMNQDETAFKIALKNFGEYMGMVLKGKKEAFKGAGYKTGAFPETETGKAPNDLDKFWK